jgi:uncharacterized protein YkwD
MKLVRSNSIAGDALSRSNAQSEKIAARQVQMFKERSTILLSASLLVAQQLFSFSAGFAQATTSSPAPKADSLTMAQPQLLPESPKLAPTAADDTASNGKAKSQSGKPGADKPSSKASSEPISIDLDPDFSSQKSRYLPVNGKSKTAQRAGSASPASGSPSQTSVNVPSTGTTSVDQKHNGSLVDNYPTVGRMEIIILGEPNPNIAIEKRLDALEQAVFKKTTPDDSLFDRTQKLKATVLGTADEVPEGQLEAMAGLAGLSGLNGLSSLEPRPSDLVPSETTYLDEIANRPENQAEASDEDLERFAIELINYVRSQMGYAPLAVDPTATKMAKAHVTDMGERDSISHVNASGDNPDLRYTIAGGTDCVTESVVSLSGIAHRGKPTKALVAKLFKNLMARQDDRDALASPEATAVGVAMSWMKSKPSLIGCIEVITKHGDMAPISTPIAVGDRVEVKGIVVPPYHFEKVTIAWEGRNPAMSSASDEGEEALPYFPPLDYVAYANKAEHDYEKTITALRTIGLVAAIAGGVFIPPVALAAPMIVAAGSMSEPKPMSDIPVHGGVHIDGQAFTAHVPISNGGKEGLYYVTVWGSIGKGGKAVPLSRRVFSVAGTSADESHSHKNRDVKRKLETEVIEVKP